MDARAFYDELAEDYDALHADWPGSVRRQGELLDALIRGELGDAPQRVLDCACGIGTQAIGLALRGHDVLATDLSPAAVERAAREAAAMDAVLATGVADFTRLPEQVDGSFACVLACDNAVAHLHSDEALSRFAASVVAKLEPGGLAVVSLRDYEPLVAERAPGHPVRVGEGTISFQVWEWDDEGRTYELAQFTLRGEGEHWQTVCRRTRLRALLRDELCGALSAAGLAEVRWRTPEETGYYQPIVTARLRRESVYRPGVRFSPLATRLDRDATGAWRMHALATRRLARGDDIIMLTIGDPDFETPPVVVDAAIASMRRGRTHYSFSQGDLGLREAIAARASGWAGRTVDPRQVVFFPGAQSALFCVCSCVLGDGDEVIVPEPFYATYPGVFAASGVTPVHVPLRPERGFHLDVAEVEAALSERTRAIVLNTPHNPTGACMSADTLAALGRICQERDLWLVSDEVYASLVFGGRPHASVLAVAGAGQRAVAISSLSKSHAMTGWRAGWAIVPDELARHLVLLLDCMLFGSPPFVMDAATSALLEAETESAAMRAAYESRAAVVARLDGQAGLRCHEPEGGMFIMLDVRACGLPAGEFAERLLEQEAVSVLPTDAFGPSGVGHVRISLAADEQRLAEGCERIARFAAGLGA
jgi:arginine:pyruvate transaminase